jgi:hypothetical protein
MLAASSTIRQSKTIMPPIMNDDLKRGIAVALGLWVMVMYGNSAIIDVRERRKTR